MTAYRLIRKSLFPKHITPDELRPALGFLEDLALVFADDRDGQHIESAKEKYQYDDRRDAMRDALFYKYSIDDDNDDRYK
jgi:hypothetical protein